MKWLCLILLCACTPRAEREYQGLRGGRHADAMMYRYFVPPSASAQHRLPLVIYLHSNGRQGSDNEKQVDFRVTRWVQNQAAHPCFVLAPQLPEGRWVDADPAAGNYEFGAPSKAMTLLLSLVEKMLGEYPIDRTRIYVVGTSLGGFGSWDLLARRPAWIAAAVPIEGGGDPAQAARFARIPIWAFHGALDHTVPVSGTRAMIEALRAAGGSPRYTEYPDIDHDSPSRVFLPETGLDAWLFAQRSIAQ